VSAWVWIAVAALGAVGAMARFLLDSAISAWAGRTFPYGTFAINMTGTLLLGVLTGLAVEGDLLVLAGTATLGSYTTFSTWMFESHRLAEEGEMPSAIANVLVSLAVGVGAAVLGRAIGLRA
jgi:fluoride exporter